MSFRKIIFISFCLKLICFTGCNTDLGSKSENSYENYIELNAVDFLKNEILKDLDKFSKGNELFLDDVKNQKITSKDIYIAKDICSWTPQFGDFDYPINLPSFDCYHFPSSENYSLVSTEEFIQNEYNYLVIVSRPLVYDWGGYIEVALHSKKFGSNNPIFFIVQKDNKMYLYSVGSKSSL